MQLTADIRLSWVEGLRQYTPDLVRSPMGTTRVLHIRLYESDTVDLGIVTWLPARYFWDLATRTKIGTGILHRPDSCSALIYLPDYIDGLPVVKKNSDQIKNDYLRLINLCVNLLMKSIANRWLVRNY
jgi:hypothetical protein